MSQDQKLKRLGEIRLFSKLDRKHLEQVAEAVTEVDVKAGTVLARQGHRGGEAFVIVNGTAAVHVDDEEVAEIGAGELIGEMGLIDGGPRAATLVAKTDLDLYVIEPGHFQAVLDEPGVAKALLLSVTQRLRHVDELLHSR